MIILEYQRRSLFSVIFSSSIPFCKSDYFITKNKDAVRHHHHHHRIKDVNHIRSHRCPSHHVESFLNKNKTHYRNLKRVPIWFSQSFLLLFVRYLHFYLQQSSSSSSSTNSTGHVNGSSSVNNDGTQSTSSSSLPKPTSYNSHIITNQAPYHYGHRTRHPRHTDLVKRPTGIPRNGLIRVPAPLPGVLTDKSGQAFVPKQMACVK
mgnify:FL=1